MNKKNCITSGECFSNSQLSVTNEKFLFILSWDSEFKWTVSYPDCYGRCWCTYCSVGGMNTTLRGRLLFPFFLSPLSFHVDTLQDKSFTFLQCLELRGKTKVCLFSTISITTLTWNTASLSLLLPSTMSLAALEMSAKHLTLRDIQKPALSVKQTWPIIVTTFYWAR